MVIPAPTEEETKKEEVTAKDEETTKAEESKKNEETSKDDTKVNDTTTAASPDSVPSTGDNFSIMVFVVLALISTGALGIVATTDKKKRRV